MVVTAISVPSVPGGTRVDRQPWPAAVRRADLVALVRVVDRVLVVSFLVPFGRRDLCRPLRAAGAHDARAARYLPVAYGAGRDLVAGLAECAGQGFIQRVRVDR